jgi:hypothetical protein
MTSVDGRDPRRSWDHPDGHGPFAYRDRESLYGTGAGITDTEHAGSARLQSERRLAVVFVSASGWHSGSGEEESVVGNRGRELHRLAGQQREAVDELLRTEARDDCFVVPGRTVADVDAAFKDDEEVETRCSGGHERASCDGGFLHPIAAKGVDQAELHKGYAPWSTVSSSLGRAGMCSTIPMFGSKH